MKKTDKIAYVVTPNNYNTWVIYYFALLNEQGEAMETHHMSGYGEEQLLKYLKGTEQILDTSGVDRDKFIDWVWATTNQDVSGFNKYSKNNLPNQTYISEMVKLGAKHLQNKK